VEHVVRRAADDLDRAQESLLGARGEVIRDDDLDGVDGGFVQGGSFSVLPH